MSSEQNDFNVAIADDLTDHEERLQVLDAAVITALEVTDHLLGRIEMIEYNFEQIQEALEAMGVEFTTTKASEMN